MPGPVGEGVHLPSRREWYAPLKCHIVRGVRGNRRLKIRSCPRAEGALRAGSFRGASGAGRRGERKGRGYGHEQRGEQPMWLPRAGWRVPRAAAPRGFRSKRPCSNGLCSNSLRSNRVRGNRVRGSRRVRSSNRVRGSRFRGVAAGAVAVRGGGVQGSDSRVSGHDSLLLPPPDLWRDVLVVLRKCGWRTNSRARKSAHSQHFGFNALDSR